MRSSARIVVEAGPGGGTRFVTVAGTGALTPRRTGPERVHLVAAAGGPLGGDEHDLVLQVGRGATLQVCSAAATIVLAAGPERRSRLRVRAEVAEGGRLVLTPGLVLVTRRGVHNSSTEIEVADGGSLLARELLVSGRTGEPGGTASFRTRLDVGGRPAVRQTVRLDDDPATTGPAVLAGARAVGQLLVAGSREVPSGTRGPHGAWLPSATPGCAVYTVTSTEPLEVERSLDQQLARIVAANRAIEAKSVPVEAA